MFVVIFLLTSIVVPSVASANGFSIAVNPHIDTPDREVSFLGSSYKISQVAQRDPGDILTASISGPDRKYVLYLYNSNKQAVGFRQGSGEGQYSFDLSGRTPGSYSLALYRRDTGEFDAIYPIVVRGYDVKLTIPSEAKKNSKINATVSVEKIAGSKSIDSVEVAIADDTATVRVDAEKKAANTYEKSISLSKLDPGNYQAYAAVRGTKESFDKKERLGISEQHNLKISEISTQTATPKESPKSETEETTDTHAETETESQQSVPAGGSGGVAGASTEVSTGASSSDDRNPSIQSTTESETATTPSENTSLSGSPGQSAEGTDSTNSGSASGRSNSHQGSDSTVITPATETLTMIESQQRPSLVQNLGSAGLIAGAAILLALTIWRRVF